MALLWVGLWLVQPAYLTGVVLGEPEVLVRSHRDLVGGGGTCGERIFNDIAAAEGQDSDLIAEPFREIQVSVNTCGDADRLRTRGRHCPLGYREGAQVNARDFIDVVFGEVDAVGSRRHHVGAGACLGQSKFGDLARHGDARDLIGLQLGEPDVSVRRCGWPVRPRRGGRDIKHWKERSTDRHPFDLVRF